MIRQAQSIGIKVGIAEARVRCTGRRSVSSRDSAAGSEPSRSDTRVFRFSVTALVVAAALAGVLTGQPPVLFGAAHAAVVPAISAVLLEHFGARQGPVGWEDEVRIKYTNNGSKTAHDVQGSIRRDEGGEHLEIGAKGGVRWEANSPVVAFVVSAQGKGCTVVDGVARCGDLGPGESRELKLTYWMYDGLVRTAFAAVSAKAEPYLPSFTATTVGWGEQ